MGSVSGIAMVVRDQNGGSLDVDWVQSPKTQRALCEAGVRALALRVARSLASLSR